jgi:hypothetical protein
MGVGVKGVEGKGSPRVRSGLKRDEEDKRMTAFFEK